MTEPASNGESRGSSPVIPGWLSAVAIAVAVVAVSALVWALFKNTVGPGEAVRGFYDAVANDDCEEAWGLMSESYKTETDQGAFCSAVSAASAQAPQGTHVNRVTLLGEEGKATRAEVEMDPGEGVVVWQVERDPDRWLIVAVPEGAHLSLP